MRSQREKQGRVTFVLEIEKTAPPEAAPGRRVLPHPERGAGRRSVPEPDPHLPIVWRELLRLPGRAAAPRLETGRLSHAVDAMELSRDFGAPRFCLALL